MSYLIHTKQDLNFKLDTLPEMPLPTKVLMVTPTFFNVDTPINAHMLDAQGNKHQLDKSNALNQWNELKTIYHKLNFTVNIIEGNKGFPDMVFCANQSFPYLDISSRRHAILSNMFHETRRQEIEPINNFLTAQKYSTRKLEYSLSEMPKEYQPFSEVSPTYFEGMGDALWLGKKRFILGGYGFRTQKESYDKLSKITQIPMALFELKNPKFYHLDTCLSILNSTTALVCKEAFTKEGIKLLEALFSNLFEVSLEEADAPGFACNAHCPDEKHVIIQTGNKKTIELIKLNGFIPIETDTSEFIKSGGSVFCMKLMFF